MLRFSKAQQASLHNLGFERFVEEVRAYLEQQFPRLHAARGQEQTRALIRDGVERAAGYGVVEDRDVRRFVVLLFAHGVGFETKDEHAWIRDILDNEERTGRWKMDRIQDGLLADGSEH